jgi:SAM-dependent methyltransferase
VAKKQLKLVLRECCVADLTRGWPPGAFFEAGAGTGHMASLFLERGFTGVAHDLGETSPALMRDRFRGNGERMCVIDGLDEAQDGRFEHLLAFEVLEHIEEDAPALSAWARKLKSCGKVVISVPAHQRKYGPSDVVLRHVRHYEGV